MALSDQASSGVDAGLKSKVKVLIVAKALSVLKGGAGATNPANTAEIRLAGLVLNDPDGWAATAAFAVASLMSGPLNSWPNAALANGATATDAELRAALLQGATAVWDSMAGSV